MYIESGTCPAQVQDFRVQRIIVTPGCASMPQVFITGIKYAWRKKEVTTKRKIVSDSSCDMLTMPGIDFASVPLTISTDEKSYIDDASLDVGEMLDYLAGYQGRSYTACPSISSWTDSFADADEIFIVTISSNVSGSYNAAVAARELYLQSHPDAKIFILDSLSAGPEQRLLIEKIGELITAGLSFEQICRQAREYAKRTHIFYTLESMHNLVQNGRVSKLTATLAGILGIRVLGTASEKGTLEPVAKCRGEKKTISTLLEQLRQAGYCGGKMCIAHVQNLKLANEIKETIQKHYAQAKIFIDSTRGLCSYYAERGGVLVGFECAGA